MTGWLSLKNAFDIVAALLAAAALLAVLQTFVIGQHYIIPTAWLVVAVLFGNLARFGFAGSRWAKQVLFWIGVIATAHLFMALFFAKTPRELLGAGFLPVFGVAFVVMALLSWQYGRRNGVFQNPGPGA